MRLHVITDFSVADGAQTMLLRLLQRRADQPVTVVSLTTIAPEIRARAGAEGVTYVALDIRGAADLPLAVLRLARLMRRTAPESVLLWMYHAAILGTLAHRLGRVGAPVYWTVRQALDDTGSMSRSMRMAIRLCAALSRRADRIIYNSRRARSQHEAVGFAGDAAIVIQNGFDLPADPDLSPRAARVFGIAGRHHAQKDHPTFLAAAAEVARAVPDARFVGAGTGMTADNAELARQIAAAGLDPARFRLLGRLSDMGAFYEGIDALVLSSRTEGFPNVVAEAMAHGRPVIGTDVGDVAEIVGDAGYVVPPRAPQALAASMIRLARAAPQDWAVMAERAAATVRARFDLPRIAARYDTALSPAPLPADPDGGLAVGP